MQESHQSKGSEITCAPTHCGSWVQHQCIIIYYDDMLIGAPSPCSPHAQRRSSSHSHAQDQPQSSSGRPGRRRRHHRQMLPSSQPQITVQPVLHPRSLLRRLLPSPPHSPGSHTSWASTPRSVTEKEGPEHCQLPQRANIWPDMTWSADLSSYGAFKTCSGRTSSPTAYHLLRSWERPPTTSSFQLKTLMNPNCIQLPNIFFLVVLVPFFGLHYRGSDAARLLFRLFFKEKKITVHHSRAHNASNYMVCVAELKGRHMA